MLDTCHTQEDEPLSSYTWQYAGWWHPIFACILLLLSVQVSYSILRSPSCCHDQSWQSAAHLSLEKNLGEYDARITALERGLFLLHQDDVGRKDYASRLNGGTIVMNLTTLTDSKNHPLAVLDQDVRDGRCWTINGSSGQLGVHFQQHILIHNVTIDHLPKELALESMRKAPRLLIVWGVLDETHEGLTLETARPAITILRSRSTPPIDGGFTYTPLALIEYNIDQPLSHIQTFPVFDSVTRCRIGFKIVVFEIVNNWGDSATCLYRARIHGTPLPLDPSVRRRDYASLSAQAV